MLRRRIFSSAMASVMALSSVAVVANAEETQMKTKADLEKLVYETYGSDFRADELSEYGSVSADNVLDALEAAEAILAEEDSNEEDFTVAYMMVEATVARLVIHTAEELEALIAKCTTAYESNNIYNEELQDLIYSTDAYMPFTDAYENATGFVTSTSSVDITEAYEELDAAYTELLGSKNAVVSKSMFRNVLKQYEAIIASQYDYDTWRRGTLSWTTLNDGSFWAAQGKNADASYGLLYGAVMEVNDAIVDAYDSIDAIKGLSMTSDDEIVAGYKLAQDAVATFKAWSADSSSRATKAGVNSLLKKYHSNLVYDYAKTTAEELLAKLQDGAFYFSDSANNWAWTCAVDGTPEWNVSEKDVDVYGGQIYTKLVDADLTVKMNRTVYVPVDASGYYIPEAADLVTTEKPTNTQVESLQSTYSTLAKFVPISKGTKFDLTTLIDVPVWKVTADKDLASGQNNTADNAYEFYADWAALLGNDYDALTAEGKRFEGHYGSVSGNGVWGTSTTAPETINVRMSLAYEIADAYLADGKSNIIKAIDTTGVVAADATGSSKEWVLVYRYLEYALKDKYDATITTSSYTRADVQKLIDDCYDLADLTGDAAIFNDTHVALVNARQEAQDWVKASKADKLYKEYTAAGSTAIEYYESSTTAYETLKDAYDKLMSEYNAMKYSFGEIYDAIAEVSEMIDDGDLEATDALLAALDETAYALSTVSDLVNNSYDENPAFDVDRVLQRPNRVITNTGDAVTIATINEGVTTKDGANPTHAALVTAYEALQAAVKAQTEPATTLGDVNGDGVINALDAAEILKSVVGLATVDATAADYNADGVVNALDASAILQAIVNGTV